MEAEKIATGWIDPEHVSGFFAQNIASQLRDMEYFGCAGRVLRYTAAQPVDARNKLVEIFMEETNDDWLWMVDADMLFDKGHVMKLWQVASEYGATMVSGLAFIDREKPVPSYFVWQENGKLFHPYNFVPTKPTPVAATGLASLLVHRKVFEDTEPARHPERRWFDFETEREAGIAGDGVAGIDVGFCLRAAKAGHKLMLNPDARTDHLENRLVNYETWKEAWSES